MEVCVYADADERRQVFEFLDGLPVEYHKEYKRFNKIVKVPRGQASFTLNASIHYDYKVSGGSPPNTVMCDTLKEITRNNTHVASHLTNLTKCGECSVRTDNHCSG